MADDLPPRSSSRVTIALLAIALACSFVSARVTQACAQRGSLETGSRTAAQEAEAARIAGRSEQAMILYQKALALDADWADGWKQFGILAADRNDFELAHDAFVKLTKLQPGSGDSWALLGLCEFRMGRNDLALGHLEKGRTLPFADHALRRLVDYHAAAIMLSTGDFDTAQDRLTSLAREGVASQELIEAFGLAALRIEALPGEEPSPTRSLVKDAGEVLLHSIHQPSETTRAEFRKLIERYSTTPNLQYAFGNFLASHALYDQAREAFQREIQNSPRHALARVQIAVLDLQPFDQPVEAKALAEDAVGLAPELFAGHLVLGRSLMRLNDTERAIRELETAARLAPRSRQVHFELLNAYRRARRNAEVEREEAILRKLHEYESAVKVYKAGKSAEKSPSKESGPSPPRLR